MKISLRWLSDYVDLDDVSPSELAERLTLATAEIEEVVRVPFVVDGVVVARVESVAALPGGERHQVLRLDIGTGQPVTTVSTATNARAGMCTAYAGPGAEVGGTVVGVQLFGDVSSTGMVCSAAELGWGSAHEGVVDLPRGIAPGTPLAELVPRDDHVLEIDNKSLTHRPDLWGHYGFAREVAAVLGRPLRPLPTADLDSLDHLPEYPLALEATDACQVFTCLAVDIASQGPSPVQVQQRLHVLGMRSLGAVVDATNYVMCELGQPTHIYDRDLVGGLSVARAGVVDSLTTLDGVTRALLPADLLILGDGRPVGLAGVMGGLDSGVGTGTTRLLLESANFNPVDIRRTSVRTGLRTDASQRFEKGQPPRNARTGLARLVQLLTEAGVSPEAVSSVTMRGDEGPSSWDIHLCGDEVSAVAGAPIPRKTTDTILHSLGFGTRYDEDRLVVTVPAFRSRADISLPIDVVEEVLRVHGFGQIEPDMPAVPAEATPVHLGIRRAHTARRVLAAGHRMHEVESYIWFDDTWLARIGFEPGTTLRLRNPMAPEKARLRTTLLPNLFQAAAGNLDHADAYALFELGHVFIPGGAPDRRSSDPGHTEQQWLAAVDVAPARSGPSEGDQVRRVVAALEDLGRAVTGTPLTVSAAMPLTQAPWQQRGGWAEVRHDGVTVGSLGILLGDPKLTVVKNRQAVWFEIDLEKLSPSRIPSYAYRPVPVVPGSRQDFAVLWPAERPFAELEVVLQGFRHSLCVDRRLLDVFSGDSVSKGTCSYTFRFWLQHPERTLLANDINGFRSDLLDYLDGFGVGLR
jgi:phenylalanyl-tRNA synthetase beta chain